LGRKQTKYPRFLGHARQLLKDLPELPAQQPEETKVVVDTEPLVTLRATLACNLCTKDEWESFRRNPPAQEFSISLLGEFYTPALGGMKSVCQPNWRVQLKLSCNDLSAQRSNFKPRLHPMSVLTDCFFEHLASDSTPRPSVWRVPRSEGEAACEYHKRALEKARDESATLIIN
jgi:hypothetical protein